MLIGQHYPGFYRNRHCPEPREQALKCHGKKDSLETDVDSESFEDEFVTDEFVMDVDDPESGTGMKHSCDDSDGYISDSDMSENVCKKKKTNRCQPPTSLPPGSPMPVAVTTATSHKVTLCWNPCLHYWLSPTVTTQM
jgi:hypothetical protein